MSFLLLFTCLKIRATFKATLILDNGLNKLKIIILCKYGLDAKFLRDWAYEVERLLTQVECFIYCAVLSTLHLISHLLFTTVLWGRYTDRLNYLAHNHIAHEWWCWDLSMGTPDPNTLLLTIVIRGRKCESLNCKISDLKQKPEVSLITIVK